MKFIENMFNMAGLILLGTAAYQIIKIGVYTPLEYFILGLSCALIGAGFKGVLDSAARNKFMKED